MLKLETHEIEAIRLAQEKTAELKKARRFVSCPFVHTVDSLLMKWHGNVSQEVCRICHKWMMTDYTTYTHPCNDLTIIGVRIRNRFWRNPDDEYFI